MGEGDVGRDGCAAQHEGKADAAPVFRIIFRQINNKFPILNDISPILQLFVYYVCGYTKCSENNYRSLKLRKNVSFGRGCKIYLQCVPQETSDQAVFGQARSCSSICTLQAKG